MNKYYKSAIDKIKLDEREKEKAKALFHETKKEKKNTINVKRLFRPAMIIAAILVLALATNVITSTLQNNNTSHTNTKNSFTVTAYAKELTKTGKVYSDNYSSTSSILCETENGGISFAFEFPIQCKGENIDTITYNIENGAFKISNQKGNSIVVSGEKLKEELNVPGSTKNETFTCENAISSAGSTTITEDDISGSSSESKETKTPAFEFEQYKSFTVNYDDQMNDTTCINVVDTSDIWSNEKLKQYKALKYNICDASLEEEKEVCDFLTKDLGITCTVTYKDGSTETKDIVVSNDIVNISDVVEDELCTGKEHTKLVVKCFSIK